MKIKIWTQNKKTIIHNPSYRHTRKYGDDVQGV